MPTVKDVIVKKPSDTEAAACKAWPIWQCEPSKFDWAYTEKETCLLIEGKVTVTDGKDSVTFGPGDLVVFPEDLECTWNVQEPVRKHYNFG
ncbi:MAG: cupin domain-containing protein [Planctomycetota bacterium]